MDSTDHNEIEEPGEDLEVEITNLDGGDADERSPRIFTGPWILARTFRKPVTIATGAFIVLAMLILLVSTTPLRLLTMQATFSLRLDANPPWGQLSVDGKRVGLISSGAYSLFSVPRGQHRLTWRAAPFALQECVISMPAGSGPDTCEHPNVAPNGPGSTRTYIIFPANLSMLPAAPRAALIQATQKALDRQQSSETVRTGELYALAPERPGENLRLCTSVLIAALCFAAADQPLQAKLSMQLDTGTSRDDCSAGACDDNGQDCHLFCDVPASYLRSVSNRSVWQPFVYVHVYWQFATMNGRVIAANEPDTFVLGTQNEQPLQLNTRWNGKQWSVTPTSQSGSSATNDPVCNAAMGDMYTLVFASTPPDVEPQLVPGPTTASGCLLKFALNSNPNAELTPTAAPPPVAYVIQRFGVLLAVNSTAHHLWPFLPVADAYTQQLAQQWIAQ